MVVAIMYPKTAMIPLRIKEPIKKVSPVLAKSFFQFFKSKCVVAPVITVPIL